jgi:hypothetical protein
MKVILGDEFGVSKCIDTNKKLLESKYGEMKKNNNVISISNMFESQRHLLSITYEKHSQVLNWNNKNLIYSTQSLEGQESYISGVVKHTIDFSSLILGKNNSNIELLRFNEDLVLQNSEVFDTKTKNLQKIANSSVTQEVFLLFKDTPVSILNLETKDIVWRGKNVPHDELDLKAPIYDVDIAQSNENSNVFYTATGYGEIRTYDRRQKKPKADKQIFNRKINRIIMTSDDSYLVVGDTVGNIFLLDYRKSKCTI